jgi:hypothetical protein
LKNEAAAVIVTFTSHTKIGPNADLDRLIAELLILIPSAMEKVSSNMQIYYYYTHFLILVSRLVYHRSPTQLHVPIHDSTMIVMSSLIENLIVRMYTICSAISNDFLVIREKFVYIF